MKILHIATGHIGVGAVKGAYELHRSILSSGIDSLILMLGKEGEDGVIQCDWYEQEKIKEVTIIKQHLQRKKGFISTGMQARIPDSFLPTVDWADIIHIHFIGLGFGSIAEIIRLSKPKLITLRDMWFFTGVCNYSDGCLKYLDKCTTCHQLGSSESPDISTLAYNYKKHLLSTPMHDLYFSAISRWIKNTAYNSDILKSQKIKLIHNGVNIQTFKPGKKKKNNILFIAANIDNLRKGFDLFIEVIRELSTRKISITVVGRNSTKVAKKLPEHLHIQTIEFMDNDKQLKELYSQANLLAFTSREEVFGKTITEAMACGTPTVSFDIGGPSEIIKHKETGYLVQPYNIYDFAEGIKWVLDQDINTLKRKCRARAINKFSQVRITQKYISLYQSMMEHTQQQ